MAYSRWCWFPLYVAASITLGIVAISSAIRSSDSKNSTQEATPIHHDLSLNASNALRRAGFILMADLLHHSPSFFKPPQNSTIFAIRDSAIRNSSHPLWFLKTLLLYHTTTSNPFSFHDLLNMSQGTCLTTLLHHKNISLTKVDPARNSVEINNVLISNPNIFLGDQLAVHGVLAPFSPLHAQDLLQRGLDFFVRSPNCPSNSSNDSLSKNRVQWNRVVHLLRAKGYASFSVALRSVLDGIKKDYSGSLGFVTIFAPPDFTLHGHYPSTLLDRAVKLHILPHRFLYKQLTSLPVRTLLKTLVPDEHLEIDGVLDFLSGMIVNGVEIVAPDMIISEKFVVHGISRAFKMAELARKQSSFEQSSTDDDDDDISDNLLPKRRTQNIFTAEKSIKNENGYTASIGKSWQYIRGSKLKLNDAERGIEELNNDQETLMGVFSEEG